MNLIYTNFSSLGSYSCTQLYVNCKEIKICMKQLF